MLMLALVFILVLVVLDDGGLLSPLLSMSIVVVVAVAVDCKLLDHITIAVTITTDITIPTFGVFFPILTARRKNDVTVILISPLGIEFQRKMEDDRSTRALIGENIGVVDG